MADSTFAPDLKEHRSAQPAWCALSMAARCRPTPIAIPSRQAAAVRRSAGSPAESVGCRNLLSIALASHDNPALSADRRRAS